MGAWEYHAITTNIRLTFQEIWTAKVKDGTSDWEIIEQLGKDGWELVSTVPLQSQEGATVSIAWMFKRPISPPQ